MAASWFRSGAGPVRDRRFPVTHLAGRCRHRAGQVLVDLRRSEFFGNTKLSSECGLEGPEKKQNELNGISKLFHLEFPA